MSNPFDQFDAPTATPTATQNANPFDAFDAPAAQQAASPAPSAVAPARQAPLYDDFGQLISGTAATPTETKQALNNLTSITGRGLALGTRDVLEGVAGPVYDAAAYLPRKAGLPIRSFSANLDALGMPHPETDSERLVSSVVQPVAGTLLGQGVGRTMMGAASPALQAAGEVLTASPGAQAASAGVGGVVQEETGSPMAGFAASLATPLAMGGISRAVSPNILAGIEPERAAAITTAQREGVPLTLAQQTGGKVARNFESTLANLPGSSGVQAAANDAQQSAWNRAVLARAGINADTATPDVLNAGRRAIGQQIGNLAQRNTLQADQQLINELQDVATNVNRYATPEVRGPMNARIQDAVDRLQGGSMPGQAYREMDSALGTAVRGATNGDMRTHLGALRDTLRGGMDRSISPADQADWQQARGQYANLMTVARAMDRPSEGAALGNISTGALAQATRAPAMKSFAFGRGNLDDLSRLGQVALKQTVPDSGTAQRTVMANMLQGNMLGAMAAAGGGAAVGGQNPLLALTLPAVSVGVPNLAARAYHSSWLQNYLTNDLAAGLRPAPNALTPVAANSGAQMLRDR